MNCQFCGKYFNRHRSGGLYCSIECHFWTFVKKSDRCWLWTGLLNNKGYGYVTHGRKHRILAHRLSYKIAIGHLSKKLHVLHTCDNPPCVNPDHLFAGTQKDNIRDCIKKGRKINTPSIGEKHGMAILTEKEVIEIIKSSGTHAVIAVRFGVSKSTVREIKAGRLWKHVSR